MFTHVKKQIAVNLVAGSLGAGKTTLIKNLLEHKPENENWGLVVNEFGAIGIDGAILSNNHESIEVTNIPGGCICCSASGEFQEAMEELTKTYQLDRIIIEPTGLGEPDGMVEMLHSGYFQNAFNVQTVFAVLDSAITTVDQFKKLMIMQNLIDVADVVVLNKTDRATQENLDSLKQYCGELYPPKMAILETEQAIIDPSIINQISSNKKVEQPLVLFNKNQQPSAKKNDAVKQLHASNKNASARLSYEFEAPPTSSLQHLADRKAQKQLNTLSIGWIFSNEAIFDWSLVRSLFESLSQNSFGSACPLRAKGVFKVGEPRMLFQFVKDQPITRDYIAYKRDSRVEILLPDASNFDISSFEKALSKCQKTT